MNFKLHKFKMFECQNTCSKNQLIELHCLFFYYFNELIKKHDLTQF